MPIISLKSNPYLFPGIVDFSQPSFWISAGLIVFNPIFWNSVAQNEYKRKTITKALGNRPKYGCYVLGATIFLLGIIRDHFYNQALAVQPVHHLLVHPVVKFAGAGLFVAGQVLVLSSMYALGVTGTYLGDYFGILMDGIVTGFPFNVVNDPMYFGSTLCFVGWALFSGKPAGLILSVLVHVVYVAALRFERPFTAKIYAQAAKKKKPAATRRSSTASGTATKRSSSTSSTSRRRSSTASTKKASAAATTPTTTANSTPKRTPSRKKKDTPAKGAASDAESSTPAKRGRKKKTA